jgi:group I intron endonuclease
MQKISGIYRIQSISHPERCYIGSATNTGKRWNHHITDLRKGKHHSSKLQNHFNKYGEIDLQFSILLGCEKSILLDNEQFFLDSYKPYFNIYQTTRQYSTEKKSESSNEKRSKSMTGKRHSEESKLRMSIAFKGRSKSEEHRKKLSAALMGNKPAPKSKEAMIRLSENRKGSGNPMFGKKSWNSGKKMSVEYCDKLKGKHLGHISWNRGRKGVSEETKYKMAIAKIGKKRPPRTKEHSQRMWESRRRNQLNKTA